MSVRPSAPLYLSADNKIIPAMSVRPSACLYLSACLPVCVVFRTYETKGPSLPRVLFCWSTKS